MDKPRMVLGQRVKMIGIRTLRILQEFGPACQEEGAQSRIVNLKEHGQV
jgi:hypothetical protein